MKLGIDAMGGDHAPSEIVQGAIEAARLIDAQLVLYGQAEQILPLIGDRPILVVDCREVIQNDEMPVPVIRSKTDSSMVRGLMDLKEGKIDGFLSAGSTGALLAGGLLRVGRIKGIERPALTTVYPMNDRMGLLVDAGANADCKPAHLRDFALMSSIYVEKVYGIDNPKVGLVNIGEEPGKGNELVKNTFPLMEKAPINFVGSIEGRDIPSGKVDIVVTDGFTGNVILKLSEGLAKTMGQWVKEMFLKNAITKLSSLFFKQGFREFKARLDYTEYGGAALLGVNGALVKAHGSSNAKAIKNAVLYMEKYAASGVIAEIKQALDSLLAEEADERANPE
ncbi:MAG TPA: phosphate acyltransferase PlsX [Tissierellia bacterium]|nr:phosphate acyltransferase PlsX [Tissierellia bacterium]